jgi:hypothetical protein
MNQQESSYFDPECETVYEPRYIERDFGKFREEGHEEQERTTSYMTPEQSMLRGEKLIPISETKSYRNWILTGIFLLMILIGGLLWSIPDHPIHPLYDHGGYGHPHQIDQQYHPPSDQDDWPPQERNGQ